MGSPIKLSHPAAKYMVSYFPPQQQHSVGRLPKLTGNWIHTYTHFSTSSYWCETLNTRSLVDLNDRLPIHAESTNVQNGKKPRQLVPESVKFIILILSPNTRTEVLFVLLRFFYIERRLFLTRPGAKNDYAKSRRDLRRIPVRVRTPWWWAPTWLDSDKILIGHREPARITQK